MTPRTTTPWGTTHAIAAESQIDPIRTGSCTAAGRESAAASRKQPLQAAPRHRGGAYAPAGRLRPTRSGPPTARSCSPISASSSAPTVLQGHPAVVRLRFRVASTWNVLVFLGRTHLYEGHSPATVVQHGVRTAIAAGCRTIVLTNAAGGIEAGLQPGQAVVISDHLNLTGKSPLTGPPPPQGYPPRFTDLTDLYSADLREIVHAAGHDLAEAVYAGLPGPHYETPAEIRMLRTAGAGLVGMSTVLEAIAARHLGARVLGISLVTNIAAGLSAEALDHGENGRCRMSESAPRLGLPRSASIIPADPVG